jgi:hypothetical protein
LIDRWRELGVDLVGFRGVEDEEEEDEEEEDF